MMLSSLLMEKNFQSLYAFIGVIDIAFLAGTAAVVAIGNKRINEISEEN